VVVVAWILILLKGLAQTGAAVGEFVMGFLVGLPVVGAFDGLLVVGAFVGLPVVGAFVYKRKEDVSDD
jgi:hypothetical protein